MADNHTRESRHVNMSHIRSKDTKPEEIVRKYLFSKGLRYRKNVSQMPGKPDIVFRKYKTVVFVNGCFWHHHNCDRFKWPTSNVEYWIPKIERNVQRDIDNKKLLEANGWRVLVIWECELKKKIREKNLQSFYKSIVEGGDNKC
ncbi:very short patch repair endonuclease [Solobacterium moorei]|uniref:very short patch repair endonuclease n=1 Tax=Solobacterium moorei TaxID=102148 RepID=UPI0024AE02B2|nr:very short patch repair endonuclease [Solobacterium moorei]MDI6415421.1 very short patch repair endonuclease [Solobacterium moorei]